MCLLEVPKNLSHRVETIRFRYIRFKPRAKDRVMSRIRSRVRFRIRISFNG